MYFYHKNYIFLKLVINFVSYLIFVFVVITVFNFVWNKWLNIIVNLNLYFMMTSF